MLLSFSTRSYSTHGQIGFFSRSIVCVVVDDLLVNSVFYCPHWSNNHLFQHCSLGHKKYYRCLCFSLNAEQCTFFVTILMKNAVQMEIFINTISVGPIKWHIISLLFRMKFSLFLVGFQCCFSLSLSFCSIHHFLLKPSSSHPLLCFLLHALGTGRPLEKPKIQNDSI